MHKNMHFSRSKKDLLKKVAEIGSNETKISNSLSNILLLNKINQKVY